MGKRLVITEKPSVARDITAVLGGFEDHGDYYESDEFLVTFALGHLLELNEPQDYDPAWRGWTLATLPIIPDRFEVKPREGQKKRLDLIRKLGRRQDVDAVINACDAGREGEIIYRRIAEYTGLDTLPQQRLWLQSMTPDAIRTGFASLLPGEQLQPLADAAWLRGVGDWLIGMNATRALTKRLKARSERGAWSAGRVQTPTLHLLVQREKEILAHVPRTYWELVGTFSHGGQTWEGRWYDPSQERHPDRDVRPSRVFDHAIVDAVLAAWKAGAAGTASERRRKSVSKPPLPFDLTSLQREANKRFSFSARRTLNAAQRLYEGHKLLTYPRTDSRHLPDDWRPTLDTVLGALQTDAAYKSLADGIVADGPQNLERVIDGSKVTDHFAIVPTGGEPPADLSGDDARIYDLVVRQFLAALMGPATFAVVEREVVVPVPGRPDARFRTSAKTLEVPGYLAALGQEEGQGVDLPALVPGQDEAEGVSTEVAALADEEKETRPPSRLTESALLRLMETAGEQVDDEDLADAMKERGLGTPATRADIIERLITTTYARRMGNKVGPTPKAMRLMDVLERAKVPVLGSPELTGQWEFDLQQVQRGQLKRDDVLDRLTAFTRDVTEHLTGFDYDALYAGDPPLGPCPSCGKGQIVESVWGYKCTRNEKGDDACHFILWKDRSGRYIDRALAEKLVQEHKAGPVPGFVDRYGHELDGVIVLEPESAEPGAQWNMAVTFGQPLDDAAAAEERVGVLFPCPCGRQDCEGIVETSKRFVCQRVLDGLEKRGPVLPRVVCQRALEVEEVAEYFSEASRTGFIEGFTSKRGRPFTGALIRKETGRHGFEFPPRKGAEDADKPAGGKPAAKKAPAKKPAAKKAPAKKPAAKKAPAKKAAAKEAPAKKPAARKKAAATPDPAPPEA